MSAWKRRCSMEDEGLQAKWMLLIFQSLYLMRIYANGEIRDIYMHGMKLIKLIEGGFSLYVKTSDA